MTPAQHPLGEHLDSCSSPANCEEYLSIMSMTAEQQCAWITQDRARIGRLRSASASHRIFRVSQPRPDPTCPIHGVGAVPDAYAIDIARIRAATMTPEQSFEDRWKAARLAEYQAEYARAEVRRAEHRPAPVADTTDYTPPNSYQIALSARKENR